MEREITAVGQRPRDIGIRLEAVRQVLSPRSMSQHQVQLRPSISGLAFLRFSLRLSAGAGTGVNTASRAGRFGNPVYLPGCWCGADDWPCHRAVHSVSEVGDGRRSGE